MEHDEHEMMVEYAEMTSFNFNSKEYKEVIKDLKKCTDAANLFESLLQSFIEKLDFQHSC